MNPLSTPLLTDLYQLTMLQAYFRHRMTDTAVFELFLTATPVRELTHVHFGSRPAYRERGAGTMAGIRALPWTFGWTPLRLMVSTRRSWMRNRPTTACPRWVPALRRVGLETAPLLPAACL